MKRIHEVWVISCMDFTMVGGGQEPYGMGGICMYFALKFECVF